MVQMKKIKHNLEIHLCFMIKVLYHICEVYAIRSMSKGENDFVQ